MPDTRNDRRSSNQRSTTTAEPWNLLYPRSYKVGNEERTDFMRIGVAWPLKDREGFSLEFHLDPPRGERIIMMRRLPKDEQR